jgi:hypothetical protein
LYQKRAQTGRLAHKSRAFLKIHAVVPSRVLRAMKFKLKDESELQVLDHVQFYARALRAIGQDLSSLFPQFLEVTLHGKNFEISGRYLPRDAIEKGAQKDNYLLDKLRSKFIREPSVSAPAEAAAGPIGFTRTYTPADIDALDEAGSNHRHAADAAPDIYSLAEMLRMVGRIVDSNGKRLSKLSKDTYGVSFQYEDGAGQIRKSEMSSLQLYKLQQQYYSERGTFVAVDTWKGSV